MAAIAVPETWEACDKTDAAVISVCSDFAGLSSQLLVWDTLIIPLGGTARFFHACRLGHGVLLSSMVAHRIFGRIWRK